MINQIRCLGCWQIKTFAELNQDHFCENCQEKYDNFFINAVPRCDACKAFIKKKNINGYTFYYAYPEPIPQIRIGLVLSSYLQNWIKEKGGQQKIENWFCFCRNCDKELGKKEELKEKIIAFNLEKERLTYILELVKQKPN